jgi:excinuclease ABC subunit C
MTKLNQKILDLPLSPGCYLFKDEGGKIIYVGKAKELRKRVKNYFQKKDHDPKTRALVAKIRDIDFVVTRTEVEALILENNLIKKHYPRYNIDLKDSRRYAYLKLHDGEYPWLEVVRKREGEGEYYGPFVSGTMRKYIVDILRRNFRILLKKPSPKFKKIISKEEYSGLIDQARKILCGKVDEVVQELTKGMKLSSDRGLYEHAITRRDQISALQSLKEKQVMELRRSVDAHIINYIISDEKMYLLLFNIRKGILEGKQKFSFPYRQGILEEFISQFYTTVQIPPLIVVPEKLDVTITKYLEKIKGGKVSVIVPIKGTRKKLLDLVLKNVEATFFSGLERIIDLGRGLGLEKIPKHIECFDISHLGGTNTVASMVTFIDGKEDKSKYRKFKIRSVNQIDDFASMEEVIDRRYGGSLTRSMRLPDLIVIDGGKGQLSSTMKILRKLKVEVQVIALAKRLEEVFVPGRGDAIVLGRKSKGLLLLRAIRDEAHRFAIGYQRSLRSKNLKR